MKESVTKILKPFNTIVIASSMFSLALLYLILKLNILPWYYLTLIIILLIVLFVIMIFLIRSNNKSLKIIGVVFSIIFMIVTVILSYYIYTTNEFLNKSFANATEKYTQTFYVVTRKDSMYEKITDLDGKKLSYYKMEKNTKEALKKLNEKVTFKKNSYDDMSLISLDLETSNIDFLLISDTSYQLLVSNNYITKKDYKTIYSFKVTIKEKRKLKSTKKTSTNNLNIFVGGYDFTNNNMDFNMILTINKKKHHILLTSIPRDYYVDVDEYDGKKDTLSYMGSLGIGTNVKSLEKLFGISIDYYVKVNTDGLVNVVDEIGGINYCSDFEYETTHSLVKDTYNDNSKKFHVKKGCQTLNGIESLTVARERNAFDGRDRQRQKNCQDIIIDIADKLQSVNTITNYNNILSSISDTYETTIPKKEITDMIKETVASNAKWTFEKQSVDGEDAKDYVHLTNLKDYVMYPDMETVKNAKEKIESITK